MLQLARVVSRHADAGLAARLHRRFAFAPEAFAQRAAQSGQAIGPVFLRDDASIVAHIGLPGSAGAHWIQTRADSLEVLPLPGMPHRKNPQSGRDEVEPTHGAAAATATARDWRIGAAASARGLVVLGDDQGMLHGLDEEGHVLWHHQVGGSISAIDVAPDGRTIVAGSQGGYLVVLRKGAGPDPFVVGTSRFSEARRFIFWKDEAAPIRW